MTTFRLRVLFSLVFTVLPIAIFAEDWPQWRGPNRNGIANESPALIDEFPKDGPRKVWESASIPGGLNGGWGSVAVAGGKAFVYANHSTPVAWRMVTKSVLATQGYSLEMPFELSQKVEAARVSEERKAIKDAKAITGWIDQWLAANTTEAQAQYSGVIRIRLSKGIAGVSLDVLNKLAAIIDKKFENQDGLVQWLKESGLTPPAAQQAALTLVPVEKEAHDSLYCLDALTGKTLWQTTIAGEYFYYPDSSTPTVIADKVYVLGSEGKICCFAVTDGKLLWQSPALFTKRADHHDGGGSSVVVADGLAVVAGATAVSLADHTIAWQLKGVMGSFASGMLWSNGGKTYFLISGGGSVVLIDPRDLTKAIRASGGGYATPAAVGDYAVETSQDNELSAYKLAVDKIERLWKVPLGDSYSSALINDIYVYAVGGVGAGNKNGKAGCIELQTGKVLWEESLPAAGLSSPLLADKKIFAVVGSELVVFKASPEKFQIVGRANLGLEKFTSPAIANGKLYLRTSKNIICYDVTK